MSHYPNIPNVTYLVTIIVLTLGSNGLLSSKAKTLQISLANWTAAESYCRLALAVGLTRLSSYTETDT